jgi:hypothetical protein
MESIKYFHHPGDRVAALDLLAGLTPGEKESRRRNDTNELTMDERRIISENAGIDDELAVRL